MRNKIATYGGVFSPDLLLSWIRLIRNPTTARMSWIGLIKLIPHRLDSTSWNEVRIWRCITTRNLKRWLKGLRVISLRRERIYRDDGHRDWSWRVHDH